MPIDFEALVLGPCMDTFARLCTFYPRSSVDTDHPDGVPYQGRAIFSSASFDVVMMEQLPFSDQKTEIGIKLGDYVDVGVPDRDDRVRVPGSPLTFFISDTSIDGQGGMKLQLRKTEPDEALAELV